MYLIHTKNVKFFYEIGLMVTSHESRIELKLLFMNNLGSTKYKIITQYLKSNNQIRTQNLFYASSKVAHLFSRCSPKTNQT
ncbi:hypothetical protein O3M35_006605 [Rhynocoris fuscipes]|uniref:Uncharacterized protein n=1 Tax=Rhynocoris fuscipes TaxID=488301 RepID=A0AAW1DLT2_9HEMI